MQERPILFSGPMVRAILEGKKTQTRRVVNPQPEKDSFGFWYPSAAHKNGLLYETEDSLKRWLLNSFKCPHGQPGDRLWVRETWCRSGEDLPDGIIYKTDKFSPLLKMFDDTKAGENAGKLAAKYPRDDKWIPSIYMPRWASRLTLEVTRARVERLQDISEGNAMAEGVEQCGGGWKNYRPGADEECWGSTARVSFATLWDSINVKRGFGWDANPWVWVVEFEVVE